MATLFQTPSECESPEARIRQTIVYYGGCCLKTGGSLKAGVLISAKLLRRASQTGPQFRRIKMILAYAGASSLTVSM